MQLPSAIFPRKFKTLAFHLTDNENMQLQQTWKDLLSKEKLHQMLIRSVDPSLKLQISGICCASE